MKTERFEYLYLLFGLYCGFLLGSSLGVEAGVWFRRAVYSIGILFIGFFWRRIESRAHREHLDQWEELRARGKWFFVISRYVVVRGFVLLVIFGGPAVFEMRFSGTLLAVTAVTGAILVPMFVYLGQQEWHECQREFEIRAIKNAAEYISLKQN
jgi:hypothetical protein